jgi:hypothetical protein
MTKAQALHAFYSSFGLLAFEASSVPTGEDAPGFPYLTYDYAEDSFGVQVALSMSLWYRSTSWIEANGKAAEISEKIGRGGVFLPCDGGCVWLRRGSPFVQSMGDSTDNMIRRKYINITAEFITAD